MLSLKRLVHEIHRRSLWQVLGIYLAGSWVVLQVVDTLAGVLGLPEWAPSLAAFLLVAGLPVVLATAFVQEGMRSEAAGPAEGSEPEGKPPAGGDESHLSPGTGSLDRLRTGLRAPDRLFTWRRAMAGGVAAFAVWGVASAGWLVLDRARGGAGDLPAAGAAPGAELRSIAVLPFTDMSPAGDMEYFGDGMAEEILNALVRGTSLEVAGRTSSFSFKGQNRDIPAIGAALGVATVLEGSIRSSEDRIRVTAQLVRAGDGLHLWSDSWDADFGRDLFDVQDEIAREIVSALRLELTGEQRAALLERGTDDVDAFEAYTLGRFHWEKRTVEGLETSIESFRRAIEIDPEYARAWVGLAEAYLIGRWFGVTDYEEVREGAGRALERAEALAPGLADVHRGRAFYLQDIEWDREGAEEAYRRALALNPDDGWTRYWYSRLLDSMRRHREAEAQAVRARELEPLAMQIRTGVAQHFLATDLDRAAAEYEAVLELEPDRTGALRELVSVHLTRGDTASARTAVRRLAAVDSAAGSDAGLVVDARSHAIAGRRSQALPLVEGLLAALRSGELVGSAVDEWELAAIYQELGEVEPALELLEGLVEARAPGAENIFLFPDGPARAHPRFQALLERLGLPRDG